MSRKDRAPHVSPGDSSKLQALVQSRAASPKGKPKIKPVTPKEKKK